MITVNAMGDACPIPVVKTKKAIQTRCEETYIEVLVDNETAMNNVSKMAISEGGNVKKEKLGEREYKVTIEMRGTTVKPETAGTKEKEAEEKRNDREEKGNTVVVVSSDRMGEGNDELGRVLMKGFIFAVTQLEELPKTMLFYNGGAALTCEGSDSLADLKLLSEQGVEIMTCGTCLDYYGLKEKLQVGSVTNMYSIVETMNEAGRILRP